MNKSDFISDAVALDLGKSGVKVAETLEIEVGNEWWNLINSADVPNNKTVFDLRKDFKVVVGDTMDVTELSNKTSTGGGSGSQYSASNTYSGNIYMGGDNIAYTFTAFQQYNAFYLLIFDKDSEICNSLMSSGWSGYWGLKGAFWDSVNSRIVTIFAKNSSPRFGVLYAEVSSSSLSSATATLNPISSGFSQIKTFQEVPDSVYSLFCTSNNIYVKKTEMSRDQAPLITATSVVSSSGSVRIASAIYRSASEVHLFFSRKYNSAGVMWIDQTDNNLYYALESDGWQTMRFLLNINSGFSLKTVGNFVIPEALEHGGEYLIAGTEKKITGTITKPSGYAYPENLIITGVCSCSDNSFKIFGTVGSLWYIYTVSYSTMTITGVTSAYSGPFALSGYYLPEMVGYSDDRELYVLQSYRSVRTRNDSRAAILLCYSKISQEVLWIWGHDESADWTDSTIFPATYKRNSNWAQQYFFAYKDTLFTWQIYSAASTNAFSEHYMVSIQDVMNCNAKEDFKALLLSKTKQYTSTLSHISWYASRPPQPSHISVRAVGETSETICFLLESYDTSSHNWIMAYHFRKDTGAYSHKVNLHTSASPAIFCCPSVCLKSERRYDYNLDFYTDNNQDNFVKTFACTTGTIVARYSGVEEDVFIKTISSAVVDFSPCSVLVTSEYGVASLVTYSGSDLTIYYFNASTTIGSTMSIKIALPFSFHKILVDDFANQMVCLSALADGDISFVQMSADTLHEEKYYALKSSDLTEIYDLDWGHVLLGGMSSSDINGSKWAIRDYSGKMIIGKTNAMINEGWSDEPSGGGESLVNLSLQYKDVNYIPYPFAREGIRVELSNISKMTKITLPETQTDLIRTMLASGTDFRGSRCVLRRIFPDHVNERGSDIVLLDGYIQDWNYSPDQKGILFTVSKTLIDVGASFPKRLMNMGCSHVFKGKRCGYLGASGICTKTRTDCISKTNVLKFGGFPWVAARQRRIMWR
ncbi:MULTISPECIES: hypothetical protein [Synergistaceae]|uniref:hypothetical protein n=1 Tax=Synergistaceae TaxID=649777 RepID=UPI003AEDFDD8|nr:hypothetical protein [Synergistaceae bacterium DZ-S4]